MGIQKKTCVQILQMHLMQEKRLNFSLSPLFQTLSLSLLACASAAPSLLGGQQASAHHHHHGHHHGHHDNVATESRRVEVAAEVSPYANIQLASADQYVLNPDGSYSFR